MPKLKKKGGKRGSSYGITQNVGKAIFLNDDTVEFFGATLDKNGEWHEFGKWPKSLTKKQIKELDCPYCK